MPARLTPERVLSEFRAAGFEPDDVSQYTRVPVPQPGVWTECGHHRLSSLHLIRQGHRCGVCARETTAYIRLSPAEAEARFLAAGFRPDMSGYVDTQTPVPGQWEACGHPREERLSQIGRGKGCGDPDCVSQTLSRSRRLPTDEALAVFRAGGFEPDDISDYVNARTAVFGTWLECGHHRAARLDSVRHGFGCGDRECWSRAAGDARRTPLPEVIEQYAAYGVELDPATWHGVGERAQGVWTACGHPADVALNKLRDGGKCPTCWAIRRAEDPPWRRSLEEVDALLSRIGAERVGEYREANTPMLVRFSCGHEGTIRLPQVERGHQGLCRSCSHAIRNRDLRLDAKTVFERMRAVRIEPTPGAVYAGKSEPIPGTCLACGEPVEVLLDVLGAGARPRCACTRYGFHVTEPAWLYLLRRDDQLQVGIANNLEQRVGSHRRKGWELLDTAGPMAGREAAATERAILAGLDAADIPRGSAAWPAPFDGYTEAWPDSYTRQCGSLTELAVALGL